MQTETEYNYSSYFDQRGVDANYYKTYQIPKYLQIELPTDKNSRILDIGCGFGQFLSRLNSQGYTNCLGIDLSDEAIKVCRDQKLNVKQINSIKDFANSVDEKFDFITMSHVLEHVEKNQVIELLSIIKTKLMKENGIFIVMVPNGQSNTLGYWMYEDFTHYTLYTTGSLKYVLMNAGFNNIEFIDPKGTINIKPYKRWMMHLLLSLYDKNFLFWNWVTGSSFHKPSPRIYTFELKAKIKNN